MQKRLKQQCTPRSERVRTGSSEAFQTAGRSANSPASCDLSIGCSFGPGPGKLELSHNSNLGETE